MALINMTEKVVDLRLEKYLPSFDSCDCEMCIDDIKCLALNKLPPKYVSTPKGELFSKVDQMMLRQNNVDVDIAVMNAIEFVMASPRCKHLEKEPEKK
jgi:competence protein ComFB